MPYLRFYHSLILKSEKIYRHCQLQTVFGQPTMQKKHTQLIKLNINTKQTRRTIDHNSTHKTNTCKDSSAFIDRRTLYIVVI